MPSPQKYGLRQAAYTARELRAIVPISHTKLYDLIRRKRLHPVKLGRKMLFMAADIAAFLDSLERAT